MTFEKAFDIDGLQPNSQYSIRVRALYRNGSYSEWSQAYKLNVKGDTTPPSQPAAPTIFVPDLSTELSRNNSAMGPQTIRFRHDSTKNGGGDLESDIDYFEVYVNTSNSNSGGTQIGTVKATRPGSGAYAEANLPVNAPGDDQNRWFYVIGVDMGGQRSAASPTSQASSIPMIANAYISDLSADKITTGTLQASQKITVGDTVAIALRSNDTGVSPNAEFFSYSGTEPSAGLGFNNNSVGFYMDSLGRFSLKQALTFDPSANGGEGLLTINAAGTFSGTLSSEIEISAPTITGGSINIGPDVFQVNSSGRVIATNIESAIIKGGQIWIGGVDGASSNFYVDSSGNLTTIGNIMSGGSITGSVFQTTTATNENRIVIDGVTDKDKLQFFNLAGGKFNLQINGYILDISTNDSGVYGAGNPFNLPPEFRVRSRVSIQPPLDQLPLEVYRPGNTTSQSLARFYSNYSAANTEVATIYVDGSIANKTGSYSSYSDERLKTNIFLSRNYLSDLNNIDVIKYSFIDNPDVELLGFSAQQVQTIFPGLIMEDEDGYLAVKTSIFIPMLITAVKELSSRVEYLEGQLGV